MATNFSRIILAFIIHADAPDGPAAFFNELSNYTQMFGSTLYIMQTLLGDALVFPTSLKADQNVSLNLKKSSVDAISSGSGRFGLSLFRAYFCWAALVRFHSP